FGKYPFQFSGCDRTPTRSGPGPGGSGHVRCPRRPRPAAPEALPGRGQGPGSGPGPVRVRSGSGPGSVRVRSGFGPVPVQVRPGLGSRFPSGFGVRGPGVVGRAARPGHAESMTGTTDGTGGTDGTSGTGAAGGAGAAPRRASAPRKDREQRGRQTGREVREELRAALRSAVAGEVDFDTTARALTTMDASNYRRVPLGVVAPRDTDDVAAALQVCREHGVPVVARGGGTSIAGQATGTGVVLDFTRHMNRLLALDPRARTAVVQPGLVLDRLQEAAAPHGLRFGPDPSTHGRCTLGGMIG